MDKNQLYYGDNLDVLKKYLKDESVDLVYLDPPFNSNRNYSVIFSRNGKAEDENTAQIEAFEDTWHWTATTEIQYNEFVANAPMAVANAITAYRLLLGENDAMAYLVNMAPRLQELHRVLKATGSLYLHCDPTMSHYLKVLLDAIFGAANFRNEITWKRSSTRSSISRVYRRAHDCILFYTKTNSYQFSILYRELAQSSKQGYSYSDERGNYSSVPLLVSGKRNGDTGKVWKNIDPNVRGKNGMHWVTTRDKLEAYEDAGQIIWPQKTGGVPRLKYYEDQVKGVPMNDFWDDIGLIASSARESLGYPTQKPLALLDRIISSVTNAGDVVLDPFCGCGTTVDSAQRLGRRWVGIDITYIAVDLITKRLQHTYGDGILDTFDTNGIPSDLAGARALFDQSPFDFERWAVSLIHAEPNQKQVGDKGIDGVARFPTGDKGQLGKVLVSVKGGKTLNPAMVRDLSGTVDTQKAAMGVLISLTDATRGVQDAIDHGGVFTHPANGQKFPRLQHITIGDLMAGQRPQMPATVLPYIAADKLKVTSVEQGLF